MTVVSKKVHIGLKKILWLKILEKPVPWIYVINDLNDEEIIGKIYRRNYKKQINKDLGY